MLTVHHLNNSRSQRVLWLLEELGVPYGIVRYQRLPSMQAPKRARDLMRTFRRRGHGCNGFTRVPLISALWKEAGRTRWGDSVLFDFSSLRGA